MARKVVVLGVAVTKFARETALGVDEMAKEAALMALEDAGMSYKDIQVGFCGNVYQVGAAPFAFYSLGKTGIPITRLDIACTSSSKGVHLGAYMIEAGACDSCLVIGVEKMPRGMVPMPVEGVSFKSLVDGLMGLITMPGSYAHKASRHMHLYGSKPEHFARVSVKAHKNGCLNPNATYQKALTLEEVMESRMISYPITMYQCCANANGASAVVLCSAEKARQYTTKPVYLAGWGEASMKYTKGDPIETYLSDGDTGLAGKKAYHKAGIGPEDVDVVQVHDAFSAGEITSLEALGLCPEGEGAVFAWEGNTGIDGKLPVNTDGGLLSCGHPLGASGGRMIAEVVLQLRGQAGKRQVKSPRVALVQNSGIGASNVMVFKV